tara:strand:+ start:896 stop:1828 length:933 start_codon:yes stop_codon:yes gene_type:complete
MTISDEEKNSILQNHSAFYNGYATGNVPSNLQPLRVDNSIKDFDGVTVDNQGNVKTYTNHNVNEVEVKKDEDLGPEDRDEFDGRKSRVVGVDSDIEDQRKEANEMEADDMDISHEDSAYDFESDGPEQFDSSYSDDSYGDDIDAIMKMFGGDMSPASVDDVNDRMNSDLDGKEKYSNEKSAFDFVSDGGNADVYGEQATNMSIGFVEEGEGETDESLVSVIPMDKPIGKMYSLKGNNQNYEVDEGCGEVEEGCGEVHEGEPCEQCGSEMSEGECVECGAMYEKVDTDLHESFDNERKMIREMFNRFNKFN